MITFKQLSIKIVFVLVLSTTLFAQEYTKNKAQKNLWFSPSLGPVSFAGKMGFGGGLEFAYALNGKYYSAEIFAYSPFRLLHSPLENTEFKDMVGVNLLYGRVFGMENIKFTYSAGMSFFISEVDNSSGNSDAILKSNVLFIGLPLQGEIIFTPIRVAAIGLKAYANINSQNSVAGFGIGLYFGKVR